MDEYEEIEPLSSEPVDPQDKVAAGSSEEQQLLEYLQVNPIFRVLSFEDLLSLVRGARYQWIMGGETILREGEHGDTFFIIKNGNVKVSTNAKGKLVELAILAEGACFGEVSVFNNTPRTATVVAEHDVELFAFRRVDVIDIVEAHPEFRAAVDALILERSKEAIQALGFDGK